MSARGRRGIAVMLAAATSLSGCAVGPDFKVPAAPDVERYTKERLASHTASADVAFGASQHFVNGKDVQAAWWRMFRSPALNSLIDKSLQANPTVQSAMAALRAAKEAVYAQQGHYFPLVQANFNPTTGKVAQSVSSPLANGDTSYSLYTAQVLVSYTFDVWGLNRRMVESQQALADFQRFQAEAAYLTLVSNVVVAAIQEASLRGQIDATHQIIDINTKMLDILRRQFESGYANRSDVAAQEAALAQARALLPPLEKALAVQRDLVSALAGRFPSQEPAETFRLAAMHLPTDLPVTLPSTLIQQRPDVRSAEEQLHSASAQIGVAIANILPNFTINGARGYSATELAGLISPPNLFWTVAGNATQTLFDGFTLWHQERGAEEAYQQAAWTYRATVVAALQNVADSLHALQNDADALKAAYEFERAAKISLDLARQQIETGYANIILLLNAEQTYQQALVGLVQAQANRLSDAAALYQALGGGWWNREAPPAPEQKLDVASARAVPLTDKHD